MLTERWYESTQPQSCEASLIFGTEKGIVDIRPLKLIKLIFLNLTLTKKLYHITRNKQAICSVSHRGLRPQAKPSPADSRSSEKDGTSRILLLRYNATHVKL